MYKIILIILLIIEILQFKDRKDLESVDDLIKISKDGNEHVLMYMPKNLKRKYVMHIVLSFIYLGLAALLIYTPVYVIPLFIFMLYFLNVIFFKRCTWYNFIDSTLSMGLITGGLLFG